MELNRIELTREAALALKAKMDDILPILRDLQVRDEAVKDVLIDLYVAGINDGRDQLNGLLEQITKDMSKIVVAHMAADALGVKAALDEFMQRRVVVMHGGQPAQGKVH